MTAQRHLDDLHIVFLYGRTSGTGVSWTVTRHVRKENKMHKVRIIIGIQLK